jgi:hypothetical protein
MTLALLMAPSALLPVGLTESPNESAVCRHLLRDGDSSICLIKSFGEVGGNEPLK